MKFTTHFELHSQTTRLFEGGTHGIRRWLDGALTLYGVPFQGTRKVPHQKHPLQITIRTRGPDFKFELLPLHSPLLGQSLLVSFPPLIDMLKFSGYSYLIRGQPFRSGGFNGVATLFSSARCATTQRKLQRDRHYIWEPARPGGHADLQHQARGLEG